MNLSSIIKITKKEEPFEALKWTGDNEQDIRVFTHSLAHVIHDVNNRLHFYLGDSPIPAFSITKGEYVYKTPKNHKIGKITQEIINRGWKVESDENIAEKILNIRNSLYDNLPSGKIESWDLWRLIIQHINNLDELYDELKS